jgi:hypothetical protein
LLVIWIIESQLRLEASMQKPDTSDLNAVEDLKMVSGFVLPVLVVVGVIVVALFSLFG